MKFYEGVGPKLHQVKFVVPGEPPIKRRAQPEKSWFGRHVTVRMVDPPENEIDSKRVQDAFSETIFNASQRVKKFLATPPDKPTVVRVRGVFLFERPKSVRRPHHLVPPDTDNCGKLIKDALQNLAYKNDSQVVAECWEKAYAKGQGKSIVCVAWYGGIDW